MKPICQSLMLFVLLTGLLATTAASAQEAKAPEAKAADTKAADAKAADDGSRLSLVLANANELLADLQFVLSLTNAEEQKQWQVIKDYFDEIYLPGIDRTKPIRLDLVFDPNPPANNKDVHGFRYRPNFPLTKDVREFLKSLKDFDIVADRQPLKNKAEGLYFFKLKSAFVGYMLIKDGYATIAETPGEAAITRPDPQEAIKPLLEKKYDLALELANPAAGQDDRHKGYKFFRDEMMKSIVKAKDEHEDDFEIRKMLADHQLSEGERLYAEAAKMLVGWNGKFDKDAATKQGTLALQIEPLADTALAASIEKMAAEPSRFASVPKFELPTLSARIDYPLVETQQKNLKELSKLMRARALKERETKEGRTAEEKAAGNKVTEMFFDLLDSGIDMGRFDGFAEGKKNASGKMVLIGGVKVPNGDAAIEMLKLVPQSKIGRKVEMDADSEGEVKIHKVIVPEGDLPEYKQFFGEDSTFYVGTSKDLLWYGAGENALAELKTAIQKSAEPAQPPADGTFVNVVIKMGPWMDLWNSQRNETQGNVKLRKMATDAFQSGDDEMTITLKRTGNTVLGDMVVNTGILRLAGKIIADFSEENLQ